MLKHHISANPNYDRLKEYLRSTFINGGEIAYGKTLAEIILEFETDNNCEFTHEDLSAAVWNAGEEFVNSMCYNEIDTNASEYPDIEPLEERLERWEKLRPSRARRETILKQLEA